MCGSGERQKHCCATLVLKRRVNVACRRIESREMRTDSYGADCQEGARRDGEEQDGALGPKHASLLSPLHD
jgi:hypothetical protein